MSVYVANPLNHTDLALNDRLVLGQSEVVSKEQLEQLGMLSTFFNFVVVDTVALLSAFFVRV